MLVTNTEFLPASPQPPRTKNTVDHENRRIQRIALPLPTRVEVMVDATVNWNEITRLSDVSAFGAGFTMKRPVKRGRLVCMTIPMPRQLRGFDHSEAQYKVWGAVRRCLSIGRDSKCPEYAVGVAFIGPFPPSKYYESPSQLYDISHREDNGSGFWHLIQADLMSDDSHLPRDDRKQTRFHIPETLVLESIDALGNTAETETTISENISFGGAAVMTSLSIEPGAFLRVTSQRFDVTILSIVRSSRIGDDGIARLHIEFIDRLFPLEGIG